MKLTRLLVAPTLLCGVWLAGCSAPAEEVELSGGVMGTYWRVVVASEDRLDADDQDELAATVQAVLDDVNAKMSTWLDDSELSQFNQMGVGCLSMSADTARVSDVSLQLSELSGGAFDPTLGPLIEIWGFGRQFTADQIPASDAVDDALKSVGRQFVSVEDQRLCKSNAGVALNLSATAKGYAVDRVSETLSEAGFGAHLVDVGGELRAAGEKLDGSVWRVAIERPVSGERTALENAILELRDTSIATSGDYRNYFEVDGVRYAHILDPSTGWPVQQTLASVSVVHSSNLWADGWATTLLAAGAQEGVALAEQHGLAAYFIVRDGDRFEVQSSTAWKLLFDR